LNGLGFYVAEGNRFGAWCLSLPMGGQASHVRCMSNPEFARASGWVGVLSIVNQVLVRLWAYRWVMVSDWQVIVVMRDWLPLTDGVYVQGRLRCVSLVPDIQEDVGRGWRVSLCVCAE